MEKKVVLGLFLVLQIFYWHSTYEIKPKLDIVPPLPSMEEVNALAFGDNQFYFRILSFNLQLAGDTFGRSTPLKDYNYAKLLEWFRLLDKLDAESNYMPSVAAYYFSRSQHPQDVKYILDYLEEHSYRDPEHNWWWLSQSIYLANSVLGDKQRAIRIAHALRKVKTEIPLWARQMEAFLQEDLGDKQKSGEIMCDVLEQGKHLAEASKLEQDFMIHFFETRMKDALKDHTLDELAELCARKYQL